ncbi:GH25 family lysozyme [Mesorhizobium sp. B2-6-1]|uniref:glycoside hydrolase family 25 protein n=1 Tax=Mesorhizobium sp. B2-6-1 TaxID=2589916 RepID=UPI0015E43751|nr:GH25 family lysozyme [Mesorhizobium sp. B2-6-1]
MVRLIHSLTLISTLTFLNSSALGDDGGDKLSILTDDASRQILFKRIIEAEEKEPDLPGKPFKLNGSFTFPQNAEVDDKKPREKSYFGVDISHHTNPSINFQNFKQQKISFVYAKATQGTKFKDGKFAEYYSALAELPSNRRLLRGAYHFLTAEGDGGDQADTFVNFVSSNGGFGDQDLPPVVDLEWDAWKDNPDRWQNKTPDYIVGTALAFLNRVEERTGKVPMLYTTVSWWKERNIPVAEFKKFSHFKLWIADYSKSSRAVEAPSVFPNSTWHIWQFTSSARVTSGYSKALDANIFKGTPEEFKKFFGVALP